jgi:hypothetical protein
MHARLVGKGLCSNEGHVAEHAVARASAAFYSIVETAKENRLIPFEYLAFLLQTIPNLDFETQPELLDALLPWNAPPECRCKTAPVAKEILPWDET